jgi:hypothetical protein
LLSLYIFEIVIIDYVFYKKMVQNKISFTKYYTLTAKIYIIIFVIVALHKYDSYVSFVNYLRHVEVSFSTGMAVLYSSPRHAFYTTTMLTHKTLTFKTSRHMKAIHSSLSVLFLLATIHTIGIK